MGCCSSRTAADRGIDDLIAEAEEEEKRTIRVLILGTGDSGKTTLVKQMRKIYTKVTEDERRSFATPIREAIICYLKTLSGVSKEWEQLRPECKVRSPELDALADEFRSQMCVLELAPDCVEQLEALWKDEGIQNTYLYRNEFPLAENVPYFMERMKLIAEASYIPEWDDYIRFRMRTTGHSEESFPVKAASGDFKLKVTDVGGQHAERRKWMHLFQETNIHGVIYVMGANGYDSCLFEDQSINRWRDSLAMFTKLASRKMFDERTVILFFNKNDLFLKKVVSVPVTVEFKDEFEADETVEDPNDPAQVLLFLFNMFKAIYTEHVTARTPSIHFHPTTCLQTDLVKKLLVNIQNDLVRNRLAITGFF